ncbi:unnamed protein product [Ceratitis capitata]|uniref:(Mediterranean fruit fly) hypothetical protein n=1 Tax=Ceratitis capitata TaxID=7213 RepID=A0A811U210_CERCA|nr:unnamed protein product [Ceratitis capitata]
MAATGGRRAGERAVDGGRLRLLLLAAPWLHCACVITLATPWHRPPRMEATQMYHGSQWHHAMNSLPLPPPPPSPKHDADWTMADGQVQVNWRHKLPRANAGAAGPRNSREGG